QPPYWLYRDLIAHGGDFPEKANILQLDKLTSQGSPLDFIFQAIPTFTPNSAEVLARMSKAGIDPTLYDQVVKMPWMYPQLHLANIPNFAYRGIADFMVSNRWAF